MHFFATVLLSLLPLIEIEQIEQVSDRRHVCRHVWIVARLRIRQIIATPIAQFASIPAQFLLDFLQHGADSGSVEREAERLVGCFKSHGSAAFGSFGV